jgi:hypothetical protein
MSLCSIFALFKGPRSGRGRLLYQLSYAPAFRGVVSECSLPGTLSYPLITITMILLKRFLGAIAKWRVHKLDVGTPKVREILRSWGSTTLQPKYSLPTLHKYSQLKNHFIYCFAFLEHCRSVPISRTVICENRVVVLYRTWPSWFRNITAPESLKLPFPSHSAYSDRRLQVCVSGNSFELEDYWRCERVKVRFLDWTLNQHTLKLC